MLQRGGDGAVAGNMRGVDRIEFGEKDALDGNDGIGEAREFALQLRGRPVLAAGQHGNPISPVRGADRDGHRRAVAKQIGMRRCLVGIG